jgi:hypothetical protein
VESHLQLDLGLCATVSLSQCGGFGTGDTRDWRCAKNGMRAGIASTGRKPERPSALEMAEGSRFGKVGGLWGKTNRGTVLWEFKLSIRHT